MRPSGKASHAQLSRDLLEGGALIQVQQSTQTHNAHHLVRSSGRGGRRRVRGRGEGWSGCEGGVGRWQQGGHVVLCGQSLQRPLDELMNRGEEGSQARKCEG